MLEVDAIFFDVDGTLVDARIDIVNAVNYALRKLGVEERPEGMIISYIGTGVRDLITKSLGNKNEELTEEGIKIFSAYYEKHSADKARLYPHVKETLDYFKNKRKFILTNRYSKFAESTLKAFGIVDYFDEIIGGDDDNCLKPSACVLDNVIPRLNINRQKAIVIGDMSIDIMTGKNSGVKTCWVSYGLGTIADVRDLKPDYIIDDMIELEDIISR